MPVTRALCLAIAGCLTLIAAAAAPRAYAGVKTPECAEIEPWAVSIDPEDRWSPSPVNRRFWLPRQFDAPDVEALFGAPVLDWTLADVKAARSLLGKCMNEARRAKRYEVQKAFNAARSFVSGNLRAHIRQSARADRKLDRSLDSLLEMPDSPSLLRVLALVREAEAGNREALTARGHQIARLRTKEARAGRAVIRSALRQTAEEFAADALPRLDARYEELRDAYMDEAETQVREHPAGAAGLARIDAALEDTRARYGDGLAAADYAALEEIAEEERDALRDDMLAQARAQVDALPDEARSLKGAETIVSMISGSLDPDRRAILRSHTAARQQTIARLTLDGAEREAAALPETLDGIDQLDALVSRTLNAVGSHAGQGRMESFAAGVDKRRNAMAEAALSEFADRVAALPADESGLQDLAALESRAADWDGIAPETREAYRAVAEARRGQIETAVAAAAEARERERQRNVVADAKARLDTLPVDFDSLGKADAVVETVRAANVAPPLLAEVEAHGARRKQALADEILVEAVPKLREGPKDLDGFGKLLRIVGFVLAKTEDLASPDALAAFRREAESISTAHGREVFPAFEAELAALSADRKGIQRAEAAAGWAESLEHVEDRLRDRYVGAARMRQEELSSQVAAQEAERRARILAAGGDPDLVGHTFRDRQGISSLEFVDERRVIFAMMGMRFGGEYEVVADDIFVEGPNGSVVFAREGDTLTGMGLSLSRVEE